MPRPARAQGRPNTAVIPADWDTSHAPVATKTMRALVSLRHPGSQAGAFDDTTQQRPDVPLAAYATDVPARVQAQKSTAIRGIVDAAEETLHVAGYLVTLPLDTSAEIKAEDLIQVGSSTDPLLTGRTLRVVDLVRGSERFERDLFCILNN
jgi:hypothetical protein